MDIKNSVCEPFRKRRLECGFGEGWKRLAGQRECQMMKY